MLIHSVELLLNLNAFGFLREGCRLLGLELRGETEEPAEYDPDVSSPDRLDGIAGGVYWRDILERYYAGGIKWHHAEAEFVTCYCARMRELFRYVINIPIKKKMAHTPKYRIPNV